MRKRITAGLLILILLLGTACGGNSGNAGSAADNPDANDAESAEISGETASGEESSGKSASEAAPSEEGTGSETQTPPVDPMTLYEPHEETVTFMIYMTGSDLESSAGAATSDMEEIAQSGIDLSRVNLLVFTGGAPVWHSEDPVIPTDANVLYRLTESGYEEAERLEPLSMGDSANLERFLNYSYENYPADSYDLVLWDHGNGPVIGYGSDKQYGGDSLTLPEMREALEASPFGKEAKLSLIGFDACLMSSAELMCICAPFAQYMVASQETEPSFGWNYAFLGLAGKIGTQDMAREIVREYSAFCEAYFAENEFFQSDVTLAAMDLSFADALEEALDVLFLAASGDVSGDYNKLAKARVNTHGFGRASTGSEYDLVDLKNLMEHMAERYPDETKAVLEIVEKAVLVSDSSVGESCGLSLFYPYYNKNYYRKSWKEGYSELNTFSSYVDFLSRYEQVWLGTDLKELFNDALVLKEGQDSETFTMQLTAEQAEQYASARYLILRREGEGIFAMVYSSRNVTEKKGLITANFDGKVIYYSDDYGDKNIPPTVMYDTVDGVTDYKVYAHVENGSLLDIERQFVEIQFAVDQETGELTVKGIYKGDEDEEISTGKKEPIDPYDWKTFLFMNLTGRYLTRNEEGRIIPFFDWPEGDWITGTEMAMANGIHFTYEPLYDDGNEYFIMFEVTDVQDNHYASELLPITLAEAPAKADAAEPVELNWDDGSGLTVMQEQGTEAGLRLLLNGSSGDRLIQAYVDAGEFPVHVNMENILLNGNISAGSNSVYLWAEAGETYKNNLSFLTETCWLAGIDIPETISFDLTLTRDDTGKYLIYKQPYIIHLTEDLKPQAVRVSVLGAQAQSQLLSQTQGVDVQLLELGDSETVVYSDPNLHAMYKITNNSEETKEISLYGLTVNGVFFRSEQSCTLEPGDIWYAEQEISSDSIKTLTGSYTVFDREERIQEISGVQVEAQIGGELLSCPVELSEKGEQEQISAQGDVLFEDDLVRVLLDSFRAEEVPEEGTTNYVWDVWVENKSEAYQTYKFSLEGSDTYDYLALSAVAPGTVTLEQLYVKRTEKIDGIQVVLMTRDSIEDTLVEREAFTVKIR